MSRERLTDKTAGEAYDNDVYKNESRSEGDKNPGKKYDIGGPSDFAEDPDKKDPAKDDGKRNDMNVGDLRNANEEHIKNAREMERKAVKCIVASQRMLPGLDEKTIEANALDLMSMPVASIDAILARQEELAHSVQAAAEEVVEEEKEEKHAAAEEAPAEEAPAEEKEEKEAAEGCEEKEEKEASIRDIVASELQKALKSAGLIKGAAEEAEDEEAEEAEEKKAGIEKLPPALQKAIKEKQEDKKAAEEEAEEEGDESKEASEDSVLDSIFRGVSASSEKSGATSLKGLVTKQASDSSDSISKLWKGAPDVSGTFGS